jgi:leucyl-tRNA synthetase
MGIDYSFKRSKEKVAGENGNNELFKSKIKSETKIEKKVGIAKEEKIELEDRWLISKLQHNIGETTSSMDSLRVREALHNILYLLDQDLQWYKKRITAKGRENSSTVRIVLFEFLNARVKMLAPFAPFLSEEIWERIREHDDELSSSSSSLSTSNSIIFAEWPKVDEDKKDLIAEESEYLIMNLISDLQNIIKVTKIIPKKIIVYTSAQWKTKIYQKLLQNILLENRTKFGDIMKEVLNDPEIAVNAKKDPKFIRKMIEDILSEPIGIRNRRLKLANNFNEIYAIDDAASLLLESVNISRKKEKEEQEIIKNIKNQIILYSEDDKQKFDPASKAKLSRPFKPAIYMVSE